VTLPTAEVDFFGGGGWTAGRPSLFCQGAHRVYRSPRSAPCGMLCIWYGGMDSYQRHVTAPTSGSPRRSGSLALFPNLHQEIARLEALASPLHSPIPSPPAPRSPPRHAPTLTNDKASTGRRGPRPISIPPGVHQRCTACIGTFRAALAGSGRGPSHSTGCSGILRGVASLTRVSAVARPAIHSSDPVVRSSKLCAVSFVVRPTQVRGEGCGAPSFGPRLK